MNTFSISQNHTIPISETESVYTIALVDDHFDGSFTTCDEYGINNNLSKLMGMAEIGDKFTCFAFLNNAAKEAWKGETVIYHEVLCAVITVD